MCRRAFMLTNLKWLEIQMKTPNLKIIKVKAHDFALAMTAFNVQELGITEASDIALEQATNIIVVHKLLVDRGVL